MKHHVGIKLAIILIIVALFAAGSYFWLKGDFGSIEQELTNQPIRPPEVSDEIIEQAKSAAIKKVSVISEADHYQGNLSAPIQIIIYDDFECNYCARFTGVLDRIKDEFKEQVVIAVRHFPLRSNTYSYQAALAAECAAEQDKFWEMHDKLFASQDQSFSTEVFKEIALELGLNETQFNDCLDTEEYKDKIQTQLEQGRSYGVTGTPGIFINSEPHAGAVPFEDFTDSQDREREGMKSVILRHLERF